MKNRDEEWNRYKSIRKRRPNFLDPMVVSEYRNNITIDDPMVYVKQ